MKKVSLLAASVAFALVGCGGGSDNSDNGGNPPAPGGVVITGFDGYFKNAAVFVDQDNDGVWDKNEILLGLTNEKGQVILSEKPDGVLALQTITPNGVAQSQLINLGSQYAGIYTVDMDHPGQAMAHEVVFRAPNNSDVISPITDLVAIEVAAGKSLEAAEATVNTALGGSVDLYSDFVKGEDANPELHKTAQILTESKAQDPANYEKKATKFAEVATVTVDEMVKNGQDITKPENTPIIVEDDKGSLTSITNSKLIVNADKKDAVIAELPKLIREGENFEGVTVSIDKLFVDNDQKSSVQVKVDSGSLKGSGINVTLEGNELTLEPGPVTRPENNTITLIAMDVDSDGNDLTPVTTVFVLNFELLNQAPVLVDAEKAKLQAEINTWDLRAGEPFDRSIDLSALFKDTDGNVAQYWGTDITIDGLSIPDIDQPMQTIEGTPTQEYAAGETFRVVVKDDHGEEAYTTFTLPAVKEGTAPPPSHGRSLENRIWYVLENGSDDGDGIASNNYSRVWCDAIKFENGGVYESSRSASSLTSCPTKLELNPEASYEIDANGTLIATYTFEENGKKLEESYAYAINSDKATDAAAISTGAKTIILTPQTEKSADEPEMPERYTYFSRKADAEKRINVKSDDAEEKRVGKMYLPGKEDNTWVFADVSFAIAKNKQGVLGAYMNFDAPNQDFTCEANMGDMYKSYTLSGADITTVNSNGYNDYIGGSCNTVNDEKYKYASVYFNLSNAENPELTEGNVYSFIGSTFNDNSQYVENIKFNMTWTGKGDNE
ncbi:hypothetical protein ACFFLZ_12545 [Photobacterium aphoticum]|uniref:Acid phosphatase n=1 Tax=Photobacterium aphoticum TaxID=754436 RepID=A0A0J1GRD3_9GAMM|nr:hypothetical protein [Photobacterium aphoticum]KLV02275.1 hypothetical protein ABT58_03725 [Photobacterium aphoticum]PSU57744.1 hypothetical protein C9I90_08795 [Photobacterium aphoticum]GHA55133.1 hypothetical protein GCM10007086_31490 [Photobacterium aphoticum]